MNSPDNTTKIFKDCIENARDFNPLDKSVEEDELFKWEDPLPIKAELLPVEPFSFELMPDVLSDFVVDCSERMQCPPDYIAVSILVMVGGIIGTGCGIKPKEYDDWVVIPNLWGGIIGDPSTLKTPAINEVFSSFSDVEKKAMEVYQKALKEWNDKDKITKMKREVLESTVKTKIKKDQISDEEAYQFYTTNNSTTEAEKPSCVRYRTNDGTIEKFMIFFLLILVD